MNDDFRKRAFLPVVIPLGIVVVVAAMIGLYAWMLLYTTSAGAATLAIIAAAGILLAATLASTQDSLNRTKQFGVALAVLGPIAIGSVIAAGALGIDPAALNVNAQPHGPEFLLAEVPPDAPTMAAESLDAFCLPTDGGCEETQEWTIESAEDAAGMFTYAFDNRDPGVEHNLAIYGLPEEDAYGSSTAQLGTEELTPEEPAPFPGAQIRAYEFEWPAEEGAEPVAPEQFYFVCTVHPSTMWGVATIAG
ncbi:hypothetical protein [Salsipaludibacter albus]|uniref:hypothetical protein n=1 Tax=Salsipaludibacter albus TaxID=2849650 RepID=UPI001EE3D9BF|nr:hypothetical protein [Salsipaludibacter albus]MBY5161800.1 hypothetical protein [Salsipaludibacter albus]